MIPVAQNLSASKILRRQAGGIAAALWGALFKKKKAM